MMVDEAILLRACKDCERRISDRCPYSLSEKDFCPRVKEEMNKQQ